MIRQKDYQWEAAIKIAKEDGADYVAILLGRLRDAQKEIEALEAAEHSAQADEAKESPLNMSSFLQKASEDYASEHNLLLRR